MYYIYIGDDAIPIIRSREVSLSVIEDYGLEIVGAFNSITEIYEYYRYYYKMDLDEAKEEICRILDEDTYLD